MNKNRIRMICPSAVIAILLFVSACSSPPRKIPSDIEEINVPLSTAGSKAWKNPQEQQADSDYQRGHFSKAAAAYHDLAKQADNGQAQIDLILRAAEAYARAQRISAARAELRRLREIALTKDQAVMKQITLSRIALAKGKIRDAVLRLPENLDQTSQRTQILAGMAAADAWLANKRYSEALLERIEIDPLLNDIEERTLNHQWIWNQLQAMPGKEIFSPPQGMSQEDAGWWALAALVKNQHNEAITLEEKDLQVWRQTYPHHPANEDIVPIISLDPSTPITQMPIKSALEGRPHKVALLLPLSGHYAAAGKSVLKGFSQAASTTSPAVIFNAYDTADLSYSLADIARQAINNGAEMIIGPLQKSVIGNLLASNSVSVPMLVLNNLAENQFHEGVYQFSLSPENEASEVAKKAINDNLYRAAVLHSDDDLGLRNASAFTQAFQQQGGNVIKVDSFPASTNNLSQIVKRLLSAGSSNPLWRDNRQDSPRQASDQKIDMIFISATPRDARLIRPILQLHHAVDLPVYSSARVYSSPNSNMDKDLTGLIFCDMPGKLSNNQNINRLSALGADAHRLVNNLHGMSNMPGSELSGLTGRLSLDAYGRINRGLECAVFKNGRPVRL